MRIYISVPGCQIVLSLRAAARKAGVARTSKSRAAKQALVARVRLRSHSSHAHLHAHSMSSDVAATRAARIHRRADRRVREAGSAAASHAEVGARHTLAEVVGAAVVQAAEVFLRVHGSFRMQSERRVESAAGHQDSLGLRNAQQPRRLVVGCEIVWSHGLPLCDHLRHSECNILSAGVSNWILPMRVDSLLSSCEIAASRHYLRCLAAATSEHSIVSFLPENLFGGRGGGDGLGSWLHTCCNGFCFDGYVIGVDVLHLDEARRGWVEHCLILLKYCNEFVFIYLILNIQGL